MTGVSAGCRTNCRSDPLASLRNGRQTLGTVMGTRVETTAYGAAALERLRAVVAERKRDDPMTPVTVLLPNNTAGLAARRHLAAGLGDGRPGVTALHLATLPRLAEQLAAPSLAPRRPATRPVLAAAWRSALGGAPGLFAEVAEH